MNGFAEDLERLRSLPYVGWTEEEDLEEVPCEQPSQADTPYPRYNLYNTRTPCEAVLIDMDKNVINRWSLPHRYWSHVELLPDGDIMVVGAEVVPGMRMTGISSGNYILRMTWDGDVVFKTHVRAHHDFQVLPDGRIVTLLSEYRLTPAYHPSLKIDDHLIGVLSAKAEPLEKLSVYDLFAAHPDQLPLQRVPVFRRAEPSFFDLFHCNSIEWLEPAPDLVGTHEIYGDNVILICVHFQDLVCAVDWDTRQPVWVWGRGKLDCPHHASLLENGNIMIFDNGKGRRYSRVVEVDPRTNEVAWHYQADNRHDFFSQSRGGTQRLPNGNTLITESDRARAFEVTPGGEVVWTFLNPLRDERGRHATIVRMEYYETDYVDRIVAARGR